MSLLIFLFFIICVMCVSRQIIPEYAFIHTGLWESGAGLTIPNAESSDLITVPGLESEGKNRNTRSYIK